MSSQGPRVLALLVPGLVCAGIALAAGVQLYAGAAGDAYWTPLESAPGLDEAAADVEIWLDGDLLQRQAERGAFVDADGDPVDPARFQVRLDRRDRVQKAQVALAAGAGGAALAFFLSAFLGRRPRRQPAGGDR